MKVLTIPYFGDLLLSRKQSPQKSQSGAKLFLAVKRYEMDRISTAAAAEVAGISRVAFMFELARFGLSPLGQSPGEIAEEPANA